MAQIGDKIKGLAGGHFGRDSHDDKVVEAVGRDWVVARDGNGGVWFASGSDIHEKLWEFVRSPGIPIVFTRQTCYRPRRGRG